MQARYQELLEYGKIHGDYNVPYQRANIEEVQKRATECQSSSSSSSSSEEQIISGIQVQTSLAEGNGNNMNNIIYQGRPPSKVVSTCTCYTEML